MKLCILYHPKSDHARPVEELAHDFERKLPGKKVDMLSLDTRDGASMATLYDLVQYPAIVALTDDGRVQKVWEGEQLPLMDELAAYASS